MKQTKTPKKVAKATKTTTPKHNSFVSAIIGYWNGYFDFRGTTSRKDFWFAVLFVFLLEMLFSVIRVKFLSLLLTAVLFLPSRAIAFRRYHDVGISGLFNLIPYLTLFGWAEMRANTWRFFLDLEYFSPDLKAFLLLCVVWGIFNFIVLVSKPKLKNNLYRK